MIKVT